MTQIRLTTHMTWFITALFFVAPLRIATCAENTGKETPLQFCFDVNAEFPLPVLEGTARWIPEGHSGGAYSTAS